jgi:hypothetical protein
MNLCFFKNYWGCSYNTLELLFDTLPLTKSKLSPSRQDKKIESYSLCHKISNFINLNILRQREYETIHSRWSKSQTQEARGIRGKGTSDLYAGFKFGNFGGGQKKTPKFYNTLIHMMYNSRLMFFYWLYCIFFYSIDV